VNERIGGVLSSPNGSTRVDRRIVNGMKKGSKEMNLLTALKLKRDQAALSASLVTVVVLGFSISSWATASCGTGYIVNQAYGGGACTCNVVVCADMDCYCSSGLGCANGLANTAYPGSCGLPNDQANQCEVVPMSWTQDSYNTSTCYAAYSTAGVPTEYGSCYNVMNYSYPESSGGTNNGTPLCVQ